jgi:hypothetical protein
MKTVESCGCIFCDLAIKPTKDEATGKPVHVVWIARKRKAVPCTRATQPAKDMQKKTI